MTDRPKLVLLHGWGGSFDSVWRKAGWPEAAAFAGFDDLVGPDLPGHGAAGGSHEAEHYADLASTVDDDLQGTAPLCGIGFSLGAKILLELACREPARFKALVLGGLGENLFAPEPAGAMVAACLRDGVDASTPAPIADLVDYVQANGNDPRAAAAVLLRPANPVITRQRLRAVRCPVLLIAGERDGIAGQLEPLAEALPEAQIGRLADTGHLDLPAHPKFQKAALGFLHSEMEFDS